LIFLKLVHEKRIRLGEPDSLLLAAEQTLQRVMSASQGKRHQKFQNRNAQGVPLLTSYDPVLKNVEVIMRRKDEYRQLANSVRKRAGDEESAVMRAQWEILAGTYVQLADQSAKSRRPKKIDDTGTYEELNF
jgi:hypothetical protein